MVLLSCLKLASCCVLVGVNIVSIVRVSQDSSPTLPTLPAAGSCSVSVLFQILSLLLCALGGLLLWGAPLAKSFLLPMLENITKTMPKEVSSKLNLAQTVDQMLGYLGKCLSAGDIRVTHIHLRINTFQVARVRRCSFWESFYSPCPSSAVVAPAATTRYYSLW